MDTSSLSQAIKGDVITPEAPGYSDALKRWAKNAERKAAIIVFVKDEEDVVVSIKFAKEHKLGFAIRGGGHNAAGASSVEAGLIVDLSRYMNKVRVDAEAKLAYVGGGALWKDVDEEAIKYDLATVGGTVNHTGVGGLTLGGGFGWLSGRHGLVIDNLRQVTVVTANGSILTASETENPDLFWGIRGGGCNFGIVTEFVLQLHPQRKTVYAGPLVYTMYKVERTVNAIDSWWANAKEDEGIIQVLTVHQGMPVMVLLVFYNGSEKEGRENFKALLDIEHVMDGTKELPYEALNTIQNSKVEPGLCYHVKGTSQKAINVASTMAGLQRLAGVNQEGLAPTILTEYLPLKKVNSVASSSTAFRREKTPNVLIVLSWKPDDGEDRAPKATQACKELAHILTQGEAVPAYANYDMDATGDVDVSSSNEKVEEAFGENYSRLQNVKKQYDPEVFFNRWFPITPA